MPISEIQGDSGVNALNEQKMIQNAQRNQTPENKKATKAQVSADSVEISDQAKLFQEVSALKKDIENIPDPNKPHLAEIKAKIESGTYLTEEAIDETADILAARLS